MPKLSVFRKRVQDKRNAEILKLAEDGYRLREIAKMIEEKYRYPISSTRIHQILNELQGENNE